MPLSPIYWALQDSSQAANPSVNVQNDPAQTIQFTSDLTSGLTGDLILDQVADGPDTGTFTEFDPDTQVIIDGVTYNFSVVQTGTLPVASVPLALQGKTVIVIRVDMNGDGDVNDNVDQQFFFTKDPAGTQANMDLIGTGALALGNVVVTPPPEPVCFCAGTMIATPSGARAVETLVAGDFVLNDRGEACQIMWVGRSVYSLAVVKQRAELAPIRIAAGAFGAARPAADLLVSPQHRIVLDGAAAELLFAAPRVLVAAKHFVGTFATTDAPTADVVYHHILTERHEILVSNGLPVESFQPSRRTIDVMAPAARQVLEAVLATLDRADMLSREDALPSLKRTEALTLAAMMQRPVVPAQVQTAAVMHG